MSPLFFEMSSYFLHSLSKVSCVLGEMFLSFNSTFLCTGASAGDFRKSSSFCMNGFSKNSLNFSLKGYIRLGVQRMYRRFLKFAYVDVRVCMGKCLLTFGERGIQKTLIPFVLAQSGWMLYYNNKYLTVKAHYVQQLKI